MPEPTLQQLERAFQGVTIGVVEDLQEMDHLKAVDGLQEIEEQYQLPFVGRAEEFATWSETEIEFQNYFVDATGQRDSPFDRPHFTFGAKLDTSYPVAVNVVVMEWRVNARNETTGATVAVGISATDLAVKVRGHAHLTFQGYGYAPPVAPDDLG